MSSAPLLDSIDVKLVRLLAANSRMSIRDLARELGLAPSTVHSRVKRLVETGIVKRFTVLPDYERLGYTITAIVLLQVEGGMIVRVGEMVARNPRVIQVYDITGDYDLAIIAKFKSISELDSFVKSVNTLPHVRRSVTSISLRVIEEDFTSPLVAGDQP